MGDRRRKVRIISVCARPFNHIQLRHAKRLRVLCKPTLLPLCISQKYKRNTTGPPFLPSNLVPSFVVNKRRMFEALVDDKSVW
jgi:hypothetical protein